ncbi:MAG: DUF4347 domain-containing protein [Rubripirellula sp.]
MRIKQWWHSWLIAADATKCYGKRVLRSPISRDLPLQINSLEERILYSATPLDPSVLAESQQIATPTPASTDTAHSATIEQSAVIAGTQVVSSEIVIIDSRVPDIEQLLNDLEQSTKEIEILVLDQNSDGIEQITDFLDNKSDIAALHLVSHAETGAIQLGNLWLSDANLDGYAGAITSWQRAFEPDADILVYGCDLASSVSGQNLINAIAELTAADVAASSDDTGHAKYAGNWTLEFEIGVIDHATIFSESLQESWSHKLMTQTIDEFEDLVSPESSLTSLREAIDIANIEGTGTLLLNEGTYKLGIMGTGEDANVTGDFDITSDIHIIGVGIDATIIDANHVDRIFDIIGDVTVTLENLTLQQGDAADGDGGAIRNTSGTLVLNNVKLVSNIATNGGALANSGAAVLTGVIISANNADSFGGGVYQTGLSSIQLLESTLDQNSAGMEGGGLHNTGGSLTISQSTLSSNESNGAQGGAIYNIATDDANITNTTFSGNVAAQGAAFYTESNVNVVNTTIAYNSGASSVVVAYGGSVTIKNSILVKNNGTNTNIKLTSLGFNIEDGSNAFEPTTGDLQNASTFHSTFGILSDNGGVTKTHALLSGNAAIDAGTNDGAPSVDQRNVARDANIDIGAYEFVPSGPSSTVDFSGNSLTDGNNSTSITITFSETPAGFDPADDLTVVGGTIDIASFDVTGKIWTATFTANDDFEGTGSVTLANNSYTDAALNAGTGDSDSVVIDTANPLASVQITESTLSDVQNTSTVIITFSETPTNFDPADDLTVVGGTVAGGSFDVTGNIWTATFTADDDFEGTGSVTLAKDSYTDAVLNSGNGDSDFLSIDTLAPTVTVNPLITNDPSPALSGSINDADATISLNVAGQNLVAVNQGDGTWFLPDESLTPLSPGLYNVTATATDLLDNTGADATTNELNIELPAPEVTVDSLATNDTSPSLSGTINDTQAQVTVTVAGQTLMATNNGDNTWTVADNTIVSLPEGVYDIQAEAKNLFGLIAQDSTENELVIDTTAPTVSVKSANTDDPTPGLTGTTDDPSAAILVTVDGTTLSAINQGNGTWQLDNNELPTLASGTYDVVVSATDNTGNTGNDTTTDELVVNANPKLDLLNSLSATSASGTTTAITNGNGNGKPNPDIGTSAAPTLNVPLDTTNASSENGSDGESFEEATEGTSPSPPTLLAAPLRGGSTSLQATSVETAGELPGIGENGITRSIFTLSEAFASEDIYQTTARAESRIRSSVAKSFDGTTPATLSTIHAIDSALIAEHGALWSQLDTQREHMESQIHGDLIIVGAAGAAASGFTVGFIAWAFRAGFLASGLLAQLPAWKAMDPTLIMQGFEGFTGAGSDDPDSETLEEMMDRQGQAFDTN